MELPKNITQIGEVNRSCRIYVEDYVISYLKQLNQAARDKDMAVALYGRRKEEDGISYLFLYGACKLDFLQKEARHLSQAQQQEIERCRGKYFAEYEFLAYRLLNGEMIEGFHVCEQGTCRYIAGYAQFYEKNDPMLAYMLEARGQEAAPETVDLEKYETVKKRQEERKAQTEGLSEKEREDLSAAWRQKEFQRKQGSAGLQGMKIAAVAVFVLLCLAGASTFGDAGGMEDMQAAARKIINEITEQKLQDANLQNEPKTDNKAVSEEKLTQILQQENRPAESSAPAASAADDQLITEDKLAQALQKENQAAGGNAQPDGKDAPAGNPQSGTDAKDKPAAQDANAQPLPPQPTSYAIQAGDTLNAISMKTYGTKEKVPEICKLNHIANPDDIKVGQKILLP